MRIRQSNIEASGCRLMLDAVRFKCWTNRPDPFDTTNRLIADGLEPCKVPVMTFNGSGATVFP